MYLMARPKEFDRNVALDRAMRLFQCQGYEAASVDDLVKATGLSRSSLYATFGEKRALYLTALEHYIRERGEEMSRSLAQAESKRTAIGDLFRGMVDLIATEAAFGCFAVDATTERALHDPEVARIVAANLAQNEAAFRDALRAAQEQGEIGREKDADALAQFLVNALQGLRVTGKAIQERSVLENIVAVTLSVLD